MKKMTKGAIVTGLGVALLLGGGGTLAVWNAGQDAEQGAIASGDLNLNAEPSKWVSSVSGEIADIGTYRVVPGEELTYTQPLDITLVGDKIGATLELTGASVNNGFVDGNVVVSEPVISKDGAELPAGQVLRPGDNLDDVEASTTFTFLLSTDGRDSTNASYNFSTIGYLLKQVDPSTLD